MLVEGKYDSDEGGFVAIMKDGKTLDCTRIVQAVKELCISSNYYISDEIMVSLAQSLEKEESPLGKEILDQLIQNNLLSASKHVPICQDTGVAVVFVELGQDLSITGGNLQEAIHDGVRQGYKEGFLRMSMVSDPLFERKNTSDNTPAIIHSEIVPGQSLKITLAPKGAGSENMSRLRMMVPSDGVDGVRRFVLDTIRTASGNPCPPLIVGVGVGGNFEQCAILSKKALIRPLGSKNPEERLAQLEQELLEEINQLGIGPMGFGGRITALAVHIETMPCHIASLPVAINLQCHAARHKTIVLGEGATGE
jgi:fumarate hydratase subunit alpha